MIKRTRQKFLVVIKVTFLCLSLSLLPISKGWAQQCTDADIKAHIEKLNNTDKWISTIDVLKKCGSPAVSALIAALKDKDEVVRINAATALGSMDAEAASAVPALTEALKDKNERVRSSAAYALESIGAEAVSVVPALTEALKDKDEVVRDSAASALGSMGAFATSAVPALTEALKDKDEGVRGSAARALSRIPAGSQVAEQQSRVFDRPSEWIFQHQWLLGAAIYVVSLSSLWFVILWLRPLWLLRINNALKPYINFALPGRDRGIKVPLRFVIFVGFFDHHPRVIDAWVAAQINSARDKFPKKTTHKRRQVDISIPVVLDRNNGASRTSPDNLTAQRYAKAIAWQCLKQTYRPSSAKRDQVLAVIASLDGNDNPEAHLQYLEKRLGLIQTIGPAQDTIRFAVDYLAEYLAGLYVVELYCDDEAKWREFLAQADAMPDMEAIKGFLLAVRDCCLALGSETGIPSFVPKELGKRAGLAPGATGQA